MRATPRLLRQPHGCEGLRHVPMSADGLSIPERPDHRPLQMGLEPGMPHAPRRTHHGHDGLAVAAFEDLFELVMELAEHFPDVGRPLPHSIVAVVLIADRDFGDGSEFDLLIAEVEANVSSFKPLPQAAYDLDVLPRHRPTPAAPRLGGLHRGRKRTARE